MSSLFVRNLSYDADKDDLKSLFANIGEVKIATVINDRETGRSRGFGFVTMGTVDDAEEAIRRYNQFEWMGRTLFVEWSKDKRK